MSLSDSVWEIKYRPKLVESTILPAKIKKMVKEQVASGKLPCYLFSGPPGCGKCLDPDEEIEIFMDNETFNKLFP